MGGDPRAQGKGSLASWRYYYLYFLVAPVFVFLFLMVIKHGSRNKRGSNDTLLESTMQKEIEQSKQGTTLAASSNQGTIPMHESTMQEKIKQLAYYLGLIKSQLTGSRRLGCAYLWS